MIARLKTWKGRYMKSKRQSTVEPIFGTLTQFMDLRKVNTIGIKQVRKVMLMAAVVYNIKKYLKFTQTMSKVGVTDQKGGFALFDTIPLCIIYSKEPKLPELISPLK